MKRVWLFNSGKQPQPMATFRTLRSACDWVENRRISGTITAYTVDISAYHWAVQNHNFRPTKPHHLLPSLIQCFSPRDEHFHFICEDHDRMLTAEEIIEYEYTDIYDAAEVWA